MGNATGHAGRQLPADVPPASARAGPSSSQEEDPVRFVHNFFDEFLGYLRKKFQERAIGLHRGIPSPFWQFLDSPEESADDPVFLALLQYLIETTSKEGFSYPLSRGLMDLFERAFCGNMTGVEALFSMEEDDHPIIESSISAIAEKLASLGDQFRAAGIKWKGALGVDWEDGDSITPAVYSDDGGRSSLGLTIGIDLGTSYTRAAADVNGSLESIPNDKGKHMTPSWVAASAVGGLVGDDAEEQATITPEGTAFNVKRLIGRKFEDKDVQEDMKLLPYKIVDNDGKLCINMKMQRDEWSDIFSPEDFVALILNNIKKDAERALNMTIMDAIVTVPAHFNVAQRRATRDACYKAGLNLVGIISEPTAAAIAYARHKQDGQKNILVCHIGGGTFDVSVLIIDNGAFVVLATIGGKLGGEDFDKTVMRYFIKLINKKHRKDIRNDNQALAKLRRECERAKRALSRQREVQMEIESLCEGLNFSELLTRDLFEDLNDYLFMKIVWHVNKSMNHAGLKKDQIDDVVLTGGSSRIPKIRQLLREYFNGKEPDVEVNLDEAARDGAAIVGGIIRGHGCIDTKDILILDVAPPPTGTGAINTLIHRNIMIPTVKSQVFTAYQDRQSTDIAQDFEDEGCLVARAVLGLVAKFRYLWLCGRWCRR
uniref:LOW QUALITY PROTEIN: luminal-binding protein-like n=1 Tax=Elaeis guineensis var. tenera TaxID=51953 RepID=A0A6I9SCH3_ELAGV|nr:LOW QUALITY PROTEIN: luminal-binding protein-like [Elaeis guineensis]